jgi:hypothetical protein
VRQTATVSLSAATASVGEAAGSVNASFVLRTSNGAPLVCPVTAAYTTAPGTAAPGGDYTPTFGTVTFAAGAAHQAAQAVSVPILPDSADEDNETFSVTVSSVTGGTVGATAQLAVTITDDDPLPALSLGDVTQYEGTSGTTTPLWQNPSQFIVGVTEGAFGTPGTTMPGAVTTARSWGQLVGQALGTGWGMR